MIHMLTYDMNFWEKERKAKINILTVVKSVDQQIPVFILLESMTLTACIFSALNGG